MFIDNMNTLDEEFKISKFLIDNSKEDTEIYIQILEIMNDNEGIIRTTSIKNGKVSTEFSHENLSDLLNKENIIQITREDYVTSLLKIKKDLEILLFK